MSFGRQLTTQVLSAGFMLAAALSIAGCQTMSSTGNMEAVKRSWEHGMHRIPLTSLRAGQFYGLTEIRDNPQNWYKQVAHSKLKSGTKLPAVIYLHGCAGNTAGRAWATKFNEMGYAFFAPDSLARPRRSRCGSGMMKSVRIPMRLEELGYALQQLRKADWIDQDQIILMGSSEGAQAASAYDGRGVAAIVVSASDCRFSGGSPNAPADVPVLNMVGGLDLRGGGMGCSITRTVGGSIALRIKDAGHKLPSFPRAREELERFLATCCGYKSTNATAANGADVPIKGDDITIGQSVTRKVPAVTEPAISNQWVNFGLQIKNGHVYRITATGSWTTNSEICGWSGPDGGLGPCSTPRLIYRDVDSSYSALIAKIGNGPAFLVGSGIVFTADRTGNLFFRMNDSYGTFDNNEGSVTVKMALISSP